MPKASYPKNRTEDSVSHTLKLAKRYRIVVVEVVGLGAFLLLVMLLQLVESSWKASVEQIAIVYAIIGIALILVRHEPLSLNRRLTTQLPLGS